MKLQGDTSDMAIDSADSNGVQTMSSLPRISQKLMTTSIKAMTQPTMIAVPVPVALPSVQKPVIDNLRPSGSDLSPHLFMSASVDGEAFVWDSRAHNGAAQRLEVPADTPPWAVAVGVAIRESVRC